MDEYRDGEAESIEESGIPGGKGVLVAVGTAVVGIAVGLAGIVMANAAQRTAGELERELAATPDKTPELEAALADLNKRLEVLGGEFVKLKRADEQMEQRTREGFGAVTEDIRENREGVNAVKEAVGTLAERLGAVEEGARAKPAGRSGRTPARDSSEEGAGDNGATAEGGVHLVEAGDTLSRIAQEYGVKLSALMEANPSVNPRALRIGQKIVIPGEE